MNLRRIVMVVLPLAAGLAVIGLWPRPKVSPEDEVRALVSQMVTAAEKRDVSGVSDALADSFRGGGGMSRQETKQMLVGLLLRQGPGVTVLNPSLDITMESPTSGTLSGTFVFAQGSADMGRYEITAKFSKNENRWQLSSADWKR